MDRKFVLDKFEMLIYGKYLFKNICSWLNPPSKSNRMQYQM